MTRSRHAGATLPFASEDKKPVWADCQKCKHRWIKAYIPMELGLFARVLKGLCPMCGGSAKHQLIWEPGKDPALEAQRT